MSIQQFRVSLLLLLALGLAGCNRLAVVTVHEGAAVEVRAQADDAPESKKADDPAPNKEGFRFPDDKGGALLAKVLPPSLDRAALAEKATPRRLPPPAGMEAPTLPLAPVVTSLPHAQLTPKRSLLAPRLVLEETLDGAAFPVVPQAQTFHTGDKTRADAVDVNQPITLPVLARPVPDRVSPEDPTTESSVTAATSVPAPERTSVVPFQRISVPDPFENRGPVQLKETPAEDSNPPLGSPRTPGR